jgi:hypothetical protein
MEGSPSSVAPVENHAGLISSVLNKRKRRVRNRSSKRGKHMGHALCGLSSVGVRTVVVDMKRLGAVGRLEYERPGVLERRVNTGFFLYTTIHRQT